MSVGFFLGVRPSYTDDGQKVAEDYLREINRALRENGIVEYQEPSELPVIEGEGGLGRSELDHDGGSIIGGTAQRITMVRPSLLQVSVIAENPFRVAFVPVDFPQPLLTRHQERIWGKKVRIWAGSAPRLLAELLAAGPDLGIALKDGRLENAEAERINQLNEADEISSDMEQRVAWLILHEGARLAVKYGLALSLAG